MLPGRFQPLAVTVESIKAFDAVAVLNHLQMCGNCWRNGCRNAAEEHELAIKSAVYLTLKVALCFLELVTKYVNLLSIVSDQLLFVVRQIHSIALV